MLVLEVAAGAFLGILSADVVGGIVAGVIRKRAVAKMTAQREELVRSTYARAAAAGAETALD